VEAGLAEGHTGTQQAGRTAAEIGQAATSRLTHTEMQA
jgi:hypothetical protein